LAANNLIGQALQMMGSPAPDAASSDTLAAAVTLGLSSYDAEYLALAQTLGVPLVTFDRKLAKASSGIALLPREYLARV
jgi:predicted nucleic acid-binding protein